MASFNRLSRGDRSTGREPLRGHAMAAWWLPYPVFLRPYRLRHPACGSILALASRPLGTAVVKTSVSRIQPTYPPPLFPLEREDQEQSILSRSYHNDQGQQLPH